MQYFTTKYHSSLVAPDDIVAQSDYGEDLYECGLPDAEYYGVSVPLPVSREKRVAIETALDDIEGWLVWADTYVNTYTVVSSCLDVGEAICRAFKDADAT